MQRHERTVLERGREADSRGERIEMEETKEEENQPHRRTRVDLD